MAIGITALSFTNSRRELTISSRKPLDTIKIGDKDEAAAFTNLPSAYRWSRMD
jgi:hypothetical protein